ncbi:uncharacterized protein [Primulina eburnea]|uniref:uncharacterized protein n=1 Tax=Primulina eburnea TaxID=1245227 RepID=UPI003C6C0269
MAFLSLSLLSSTRTPTTPPIFCPSPPSTSSTAATVSTSASVFLDLTGFRRTNSPGLARGGRRSVVVGMAPEEEKMTRRSPLDFPIEWDRPKPGRRPDIFPQFSPMKTPLPPPMPADPPEEDEEEEEEKKEEEEEDPDKEETDQPEQ